VVGNIELLFPLPGIKADQSLRMSAFIDGGAAFGPGGFLNQYADFAFEDLRFSAGIAVLWVSPLGPLKFSLAQPLVSQTSDKEEIFQFTLGNAF
jgi:outer membrane protein insertion porin family